jgi:DNA relaxase NicK
MDISGVSGGGSSQAVDPYEAFTNWAAKRMHARGDSVSISGQGREKAEELSRAKQSAKPALADAAESDDEQAKSLAESLASSGEGAGASSSLDKSTEEEASDMEKQIQALTDQLMAIMQGPLPPQEKMQQAQPIQQQIAALQMQINELKAQAKQGKAA